VIRDDIDNTLPKKYDTDNIL